MSKLFDDNPSRISFRNLARVAELGEAVDDEELQDMINQSDKDGDGEINVDESYRIMKKKGNLSSSTNLVLLLLAPRGLLLLLFSRISVYFRCCCCLLLVSCRCAYAPAASSPISTFVAAVGLFTIRSNLASRNASAVCAKLVFLNTNPLLSNC